MAASTGASALRTARRAEDPRATSTVSPMPAPTWSTATRLSVFPGFTGSLGTTIMSLSPLSFSSLRVAQTLPTTFPIIMVDFLSWR